MSNAAVKMRKVLRVASLLSKDRAGLDAAVSCIYGESSAARYQWEG